MSAKIKDGLFIGDGDAAHDYEFLELNGIVYVVNCQAHLVKNAFPIDGIRYRTLKMEDTPSEFILDLEGPLLKSIISYIDAAFEKHASVLIHCYDGLCVSPCIGIAYLMIKYKWGVDKSYDYLLTKRSDLQLQQEYIDQLYALEQQIIESEDTCAIRRNEWKVVPDNNNHNDTIPSDEALLINTYLNSKTTLEERKEMDSAADTIASHNRKLSWIDQNPSFDKHLLKCPIQNVVKPERPPGKSYASLTPGTGWTDTMKNYVPRPGSATIRGGGRRTLLNRPRTKSLRDTEEDDDPFSSSTTTTSSSDPFGVPVQSEENGPEEDDDDLDDEFVIHEDSDIDLDDEFVVHKDNDIDLDDEMIVKEDFLFPQKNELQTVSSKRFSNKSNVWEAEEHHDDSSSDDEFTREKPVKKSSYYRNNKSSTTSSESEEEEQQQKRPVKKLPLYLRPTASSSQKSSFRRRNSTTSSSANVVYESKRSNNTSSRRSSRKKQPSSVRSQRPQSASTGTYSRKAPSVDNNNSTFDSSFVISRLSFSTRNTDKKSTSTSNTSTKQQRSSRNNPPSRRPASATSSSSTWR